MSFEYGGAEIIFADLKLKNHDKNLDFLLESYSLEVVSYTYRF